MFATGNPSTFGETPSRSEGGSVSFGNGSVVTETSHKQSNSNSNNMILTGESSTQVIDSNHSDYIFKVVFDTYGRRMATCSADRFVRLWDLQDTGEWVLVGQWQAHRGAVTSLAFCHPEFGNLLATCGSDHDAIVWEERPASNSSGTTVGGSTSHWINRASLTDARRAVTCLEFAPRHCGLKLAAGSADGSVRIYEAVDIMNLTQWPLAATLPSMANVNSLSWCTGRFDPLTLCAGGGNQLWIYRYVEASRAWKVLLELPMNAGQNVLDVAWAPNVGRRFHYIAATLDDGQMRVYKLTRQITTTSSSSSQPSKTANDPKQQQQSTQQHSLTLDTFQTLSANAWSCQWNVTGTVLASSGDGGIVQLWKADVDGDFTCISRVQGGTLTTAADMMQT